MSPVQQSTNRSILLAIGGVLIAVVGLGALLLFVFAVQSGTESGTVEVYVLSFPASGSKWKISNNGGYRPQWRRDGKELFYSMTPNVMSVAITAQTPPHQFQVGIPQLAVRARTSGSFGVTPDGQRFLVNGREASSAELSTLTVILNWADALDARKSRSLWP